jgi:GMP synthase-like glutamine amidotransferase
MKPVAIFQHDRMQGPGYLQYFLEQHDIPFTIFHPAEGDSVPTTPTDFSGLVFLGSPLSVNDPLSWIAGEQALITRALADNRPVLGHCFGGQLLAKTMGADVYTNPQPHIGWGKLMVTPLADSRRWFANTETFTGFHWHYQSFCLPQGAKRLLFGEFSLNKGFCSGKHIGLQCHLEVSEDIIRNWCLEGREEIRLHAGDTVQDIDTILHQLPCKLAALHRVSDRVYARWCEGLVRPARIMITSRGWTPAHHAASA